MDRLPPTFRFSFVLGFSLCIGLGGAVARANNPSAAQALSLTPIQPNVSYTKPAAADLPNCVIRAEKQGSATAWVVRSPKGETLRRFADTNGDNVVDMWCYYDGGLESYRDIDSDFDKKADQYRWFNTSGTRWGVDKDEDGRIDEWKIISAPEVAEELVWALKTRDRARFELLLLTSDELAQSGFGDEQSKRIATTLQGAPAAFSKLATDQKTITPQTEFADFYRTRPATLPAGTEGSSKDITIQDNASALIENGDKPQQIYLGTLVSVGPTWKLIDVPSIDSVNQSQIALLAPAAPSEDDQAQAAAAANGPSEEMQKLMERLDQLDRAAAQLPPDQLAANTDERVQLLEKTTEIAVDDEMREVQIHQLADVLSSAALTGGYPQGIEKLDAFIAKLSAKDPKDAMIPYVTFRRMWSDYMLHQQEPSADIAKVQEKWLADLEAFANQYPTSDDSSEALLQLGISHEIGGRADQAKEWYQKLVTTFPKTAQAQKANGALRRLGSIGKPLPFRAKDLRQQPIDLAGRDYRGKVVLIQYWATWYDHCKEDTDALKDLYAKYGGPKGNFEIIGVCLDHDPKDMQNFLQQNRVLWRQVHEPGGIDGPMANYLGVMTLPTMVLVDQKGNLIDDNIFVAELGNELQQRLTPATAQGGTGFNGR